ncbi:MAG: hypothetical protein HN494_09295 [Opitutae bacterium]|nr:hypothetical protein [Opitutae bacterium]
MRNAGTIRWLPYTSAGLPRRYAPRNDNVEKGCGVIWGRCLMVPLDCRVAFAPRNDKGLDLAD